MTPTLVLTIASWIAGITVMISVAIVLLRIIRTRNDGRRVVLADMLFVTVLALFLLYSLVSKTAITYDVALFSCLFAGLSTYSYARIITRGRR